MALDSPGMSEAEAHSRRRVATDPGTGTPSLQDGTQGAAAMGRRGSAGTLCAHYMARQAEVSSPMRRILVDWLVELYEELNLPPESLLDGVYQVDRFLSSQASSFRHTRPMFA